MNCRFISGRRNADTATELYREMFSALDQNCGSVYLILPEQATFQHEVNVEKQRNGRSLLNLEITSFHRLAERFVPGMTLDALGRKLMLYDLLAEHREDLASFQIRDISGGFVDDLDGVLKEVSMNGISSAELFALAENLAKTENCADLPLKLKDMAMLKAETEALGYHDENGSLFAFAEAIKTKGLFADATFFFDEFFDFTAAEYGVLKALAAVGVNFCFAFLTDGKEQVFCKTEDAVAEIKKIAAAAGYQLIFSPLAEPQPITDAAFLEAHFFHPKRTVREGNDGSVVITEAENRKTEVRTIAGKICDLLAEGIEMNEIGVCFRSLDGYDRTLEEIFASYGIPCYINREVPLAEHPIFRYALGLLRVVTEKWSFGSVFALLKTGLFPLDEEECDLLENYCLAHAVKGRRFYEDTPWTHVNEREGEDIEKINAIREKMKSVLLPAIQRIPLCGSAFVYAEGLWHFLEDSRCDRTLADWLSFENQQGRLDKSTELAAGLGGFCDLLDQLVPAFSQREFTVREMTELLKTAANVVKVRPIPPTLNRVEIDVLGQARPRRRRYVFLGGLNEGVFPASIGEGGFLNMNDRAVLKNISERWIQDKTFFAESEELLVYQGLTQAKDVLYLSYVRFNEEGRALPSPLISDIRAMFPDIPLNKVAFDQTDGSIFYSLDEVLKILPSAVTAETDNWQDIKAHLLAEDRTAPRTAKILQSTSYTGQSKPLSAALLEQYPGKELGLSVSSIEKFRSCPFAYFSQYGLRLGERKILQFSNPDLGNILHETLCELAERMSENQIPWSEMGQVGDAMIGDIVGEKLAALSEGNLFPESYLEYIGYLLTANLRFVVGIMVRRGEKGDLFRPAYWEVRFGKNETIPSYEIDVDENGHKISLRGCIDRVDKAELQGDDYFRIIDYKSNDKDLSLDEIYYGLKLQLPVYMMVMSEFQQSAKPAGIFYQSLKDAMIPEEKPLNKDDIENKLLKEMELKGYMVKDGIAEGGFAKETKTASLTRKEEEDLLSHTRETIRKIGADIFGGRTEIHPYVRDKKSGCDYCPYRDVCGYEAELMGREEHLKIMKDAEIKALLAEGRK